MTFTSNITPVSKPRMTQRDRWQQRPSVMRYRAYCDELRLWLGEDYKLPDQLEIQFYIPMPKSWSKKKCTEMAGKPHQGTPDIDNLAKGFMDALKKEDKHVYSLNAAKYWAVEGSVAVRRDE